MVTAIAVSLSVLKLIMASDCLLERVEYMGILHRGDSCMVVISSTKYCPAFAPQR